MLTIWVDHTLMLLKLLRRLAEAQLTVKLLKCYIGYNNIGFTGHMVGKCHYLVQRKKLKRIKQTEVTKTKRQVRVVLGLAGYYRGFIPSFAEIAAPLTYLLKKCLPNKIQ